MAVLSKARAKITALRFRARACSSESGGQLLAPAAATRAQKLATTHGRFTRKKAMAALAHEIAGLESPLHFVLEYLVRQESAPLGDLALQPGEL